MADDRAALQGAIAHSPLVNLTRAPSPSHLHRALGIVFVDAPGQRFVLVEVAVDAESEPLIGTAASRSTTNRRIG